MISPPVGAAFQPAVLKPCVSRGGAGLIEADHQHVLRVIKRENPDKAGEHIAHLIAPVDDALCGAGLFAGNGKAGPVSLTAMATEARMTPSTWAAVAELITGTCGTISPGPTGRSVGGV